MSRLSAPDDRPQIRNSLARRSHKVDKPGVAKTDEAPNDAESYDAQHKISELHMQNVVTFPSDPRTEDTADQRPVQDPHEKIPDLDLLHAIRLALRGHDMLERHGMKVRLGLASILVHP